MVRSFLLSRYVFFFSLKPQVTKNIANTLKSETNVKHKECNLKLVSATAISHITQDQQGKCGLHRW